MTDSLVVGQTLVDAIHQKYDDDGQETIIHIHIPASAPGKMDSGDIAVPPILALHDSNIISAGDLLKLGSLCKDVHELDLTKNCITDWQQILAIIDRIPRLRFLNLTSNRIENRFPENYEKQYPNIHNLVLNDTGVSWDILVKLLHVFPRVTELHLSLNGYNSVSLPPDFKYPSLTKLYINGTKLQDWLAVCQLGKCFPSLENLVAMESELTTVISDVDLSEAFPCLVSLNLSDTKIASWEDLEVFRKFPVLVDIRLKDIPFLETLPEKERRQKIVARLPNITKLNGSPIYEEERENAERAFIREFMDIDVKPSRYKELKQKHGKLEHLVEVDLSADCYFRIKVKYEDKEEFMDILKNQTPNELKKTLQNFCGLPLGKMLLYECRPDIGDMLEIQSTVYSWNDTNIIVIFKQPEL